jgi:hypothetical protein
MKDPQHPADDGKAQRDEQVNGPEDEGVNKNDLEDIPHIPASLFFSPVNGAENEKEFPKIGPFLKYTPSYNRWRFFVKTFLIK